MALVTYALIGCGVAALLIALGVYLVVTELRRDNE